MSIRQSYSINSQNLSSSIIVSTSPIVLLGITVYNSGSAQFILLFDDTVVPANGTIPDACPLPIGAAPGLLASWYGSEGRYFSNGLVLTNSSTASTKTLGAADCWFDVQVRLPLER